MSSEASGRVSIRSRRPAHCYGRRRRWRRARTRRRCALPGYDLSGSRETPSPSARRFTKLKYAVTSTTSRIPRSSRPAARRGSWSSRLRPGEGTAPEHEGPVQGVMVPEPLGVQGLAAEDVSDGAGAPGDATVDVRELALGFRWRDRLDRSRSLSRHQPEAGREGSCGLGVAAGDGGGLGR